VILPASAFPEKTGSFTNTDRTVQLGRQAINPPGDARQDLWIIQELAKRFELNWNYPEVQRTWDQNATTASLPTEILAKRSSPAWQNLDVGSVFEEMRKTMPSIAGISWQRLLQEGAVTYPCADENDPGSAVVFTKDFPTTDGKAKFVAAQLISADEQPDQDYPMVLITGRQLEHWHTGSMTRRSGVLDAIEPDPIALIHPDDLIDLGVQAGDIVTLESRRGQVSLYARSDRSSPRGAVFVPFCYYEAAINKLTNAALDPFGKIPEFKYCAIRICAGGTAPEQHSLGGGQALHLHERIEH
jgi:formate dehydrogenase major subunit